MSTKMFEAGEWLFREGGVPQYSIYKLFRGRVSIFKGGEKIREVEADENTDPVMLGITAALRPDRQHSASVRAETSIEVEQIYTDRVRDVLRTSIPEQMKTDLGVMIQTIILANEVVTRVHRYQDLPRAGIDLEGLAPESREILVQISRLYELITADVEALLSRTEKGH